MDQQTLLNTAFKMMMALGAALATFGVAVWMVKRFAIGSQSFLKRSKGPSKPMEILAFQSMGAGKGLYLVRCLNKKILVGATNTSIQHLSDIDEDEENENEESSTMFRSTLSEKVSGESAGRGKENFQSELKEISRV